MLTKLSTIYKDKYDLEFQVTAGGSPLDNATIKFLTPVSWSDEITNSAGIANVDNIVEGTKVTFIASKSGYNFIQNIVYLFKNKTVNISLSENVNQIKFIVKSDYDDSFIENATVSIDSYTSNTDNNGEVTFELNPGTYNYTISAQWHEEQNDTLAVSGDSTENIVLIRPYVSVGIVPKYLFRDTSIAKPYLPQGQIIIYDGTEYTWEGSQINIGSQLMGSVKNVNLNRNGLSPFDENIVINQAGKLIIVSLVPDIRYGVLYSWAAAKLIADSVPGWHLPTQTELDDVMDSFDPSYDPARSDGLVFSNWPPYFEYTNSWMFPGGRYQAVGSGWRHPQTGQFENLLTKACYWLDTEAGDLKARIWTINAYSSFIGGTSVFKNAGASVRLIKDEPDDGWNPDDDQVFIGERYYDTCRVGNKIFTSWNLAESQTNDGDVIPEITSHVDWTALIGESSPMLCHYNNDIDNTFN